MTHPDDLDGVSDHPMPEELAERLLTGGSPGAAVDEPTVAVTQVFQAARQAPSAAELARADVAAADFLRAVAGTTATVTSLDAHRRRRVGRVSTRVAAGVAAITLFSAGAAAAATGHLPDPIQRTVAQAVSHVGVDLPKPDDAGRDRVADGTTDDGTTDDATSTSAAGTSSSSSSATTDAATSSTAASSSSAATTTATSTATSEGTEGSDSSTATDDGTDASNPVGPDVTGEAKKGLCNAYEKQRKNGAEPNGVAFATLRQAADAAGVTVIEYCAEVLRPTGATTPDGTEPSTGTSGPEADTSVPKPKGPPATYKGPDEPVTATTARTLPPKANGTIPSATSVKPGNGGGNGNGGGGNT